MNIKLTKLSQPLLLGLALIAGTGFVLMMIALAAGALQGDAADMGFVSGAFILGLALFVFGLVGWLVSVRPWQNFDDNNVPKDIGHHAVEAHATHDDHPALPTGAHVVETHAPTHHS